MFRNSDNPLGWTLQAYQSWIYTFQQPISSKTTFKHITGEPISNRYWQEALLCVGVDALGNAFSIILMSAGESYSATIDLQHCKTVLLQKWNNASIYLGQSLLAFEALTPLVFTSGTKVSLPSVWLYLRDIWGKCKCNISGRHWDTRTLKTAAYHSLKSIKIDPPSKYGRWLTWGQHSCSLTATIQSIQKRKF